ncbi:hypothetical protein [Halobellus sp. GM3]|uniref:hypothetical protein n=1 Tax=Halobellus sp. GM3 TaxID=3458410 RepID=UPI00403E10AD
MTADPFQRIERVAEGDEVALTLASGSTTVRGVALDSPIVTRVVAVSRETVDARQKDVGIDGIVDRRLVRLAPVDGDDAHEAYVIETRDPVLGERTVCPLRARPPGGGDPTADVESLPVVGDIEAIEIRP